MADIRSLKVGTLLSLLGERARINEEAEKNANESRLKEATQEDIDFLAR